MAQHQSSLHLCGECQKRPALSSVRGRKFRWRADHDVCQPCWRALRATAITVNPKTRFVHDLCWLTRRLCGWISDVSGGARDQLLVLVDQLAVTYAARYTPALRNSIDQQPEIWISWLESQMRALLEQPEVTLALAA